MTAPVQTYPGLVNRHGQPLAASMSTDHEAANLIRRSYVYKLIEEEEIAAVHLGKRGIRVIKASVTAYLASNRITPADYFR